MSDETAKTTVTDVDRAREQKLLESSQQGDTKAYGQLVRAHQKRLFRFIMSLTGSFDVAEDIVQEAFVKGWQAIDRFRLGYDFYPWISTIARNLAFNHITREEKGQSLDTLKEAGFNPMSDDLGPLDTLLTAEGEKRFYQALMALPGPFRTVFVLRHYENMDYASIASYLKIPPGTVDSRLYRARQLLLKQLEDLL